MGILDRLRPTPAQRLRQARRDLADAEYEFDKWSWHYKPSRYDDAQERLVKLRRRVRELEVLAGQ